MQTNYHILPTFGENHNIKRLLVGAKEYCVSESYYHKISFKFSSIQLSLPRGTRSSDSLKSSVQETIKVYDYKYIRKLKHGP